MTGLTVPSILASQYQSSIHISSSLVQPILNQDYNLGDTVAQIRAIKWQELNDARNAQKAQAIEFSASLCQITNAYWSCPLRKEHQVG